MGSRCDGKMDSGQILKYPSALEIEGRLLSQAEIESLFGVPFPVVRTRIVKQGWNAIDAVAKPYKGSDWSDECYLGRKIGRRTLLSYEFRKHNVSIKWICDCGKTGATRSSLFKSDQRCSRCEAFEQTGQRYGSRVIVDVVEHFFFDKKREKERSLIYCKWICDCGATGISPRSYLKRGALCKKCKHIVHKKNKAGERYGKSVIVRYVGIRRCGKYNVDYYFYRCDCGATGEASFANLKSRTSCPECKAPSHTGETYGNRTITGKGSRTKSGIQHWPWKCNDCGMTGKSIFSTLKNKNHRCPSVKVGDRYGRSVILSIEPNGYARYRCDCGHEDTRRIVAIKKRIYCKKCSNNRLRKKWIGSRYGTRVILSLVDEKKCKWRCDCGREGQSYISSVSRSFGCRECSKKMSAIANLCSSI